MPHDDLERCGSLVDRGAAISPNAAFSLLHEICRPGQNASVSPDRLIQLLAYWRSRFDHPAAEMMGEVARSVILKQHLPAAEVIARMNVVADHPGLSPALDILYFSCADDDDGVETTYEPIHQRGAASRLDDG